MFIAKCELSYQCRDQIKKLDREVYDALRARLPELSIPEWEKRDSFWSGSDVVLCDEDITYITSLGLEVTVHKVRGLGYGVHGWSPTHGGPQGNVTYQVSVSGVGLLQVACLELMEDACTDEINRMLHDGWRIVAVCPPNDARRPTYIMGHTNPEQEK